MFGEKKASPHLSFYLRDTMTQEEVAKALDMTRENLQRVERLALRKLSKQLKIKKINMKTFF